MKFESERSWIGNMLTSVESGGLDRRKQVYGRIVLRNAKGRDISKEMAQPV
ncbi:MAG: hypothetical protein ACTS6G_06115 [Candidatus Hodgkinia cicadicola]